MTAPRIEIPEIVGALTARAEDLCARLLPGGRREGNDWVEASTARGGRGDSLKVCLRGNRRGIWAHFAAGGLARGDLLDLIAYLEFGSVAEKKAAIAWALNWLGWDAAPPPPAHRRAAAAPRPAGPDPEDVKKRNNAMAIFREARVAVLGTPVEQYLAGRGIALDALARLPRCLRFHPGLWHPRTRAHHPAMVAAISGFDETGRELGVLAIHRTWLEESGGAARKLARKVAGETVDAKMTLGRYAGGAIRIQRGLDFKAAWRDGQGAVTITEGIEDALTVALACPEARVLCAVSLANMSSVTLPPGIDEVVLVADNDAEFTPDGRPHPARKALERAAEAHAAQHRQVRIARAPGGAKDMNELLTVPERGRDYPCEGAS